MNDLTCSVCCGNNRMLWKMACSSLPRNLATGRIPPGEWISWLIDAEARLTVTELKRTESGEHMDLQAIRYAAMVSNITFDQLVDAHAAYMTSQGIEGDAEERILEHLSNAHDGESGVESEHPRIILASAGFSKELTTTVLWLRDVGVDISCIRLQLYRNANGLLLDTSQVIPLPEASDYLVKVREKAEEAKRQKAGSTWYTPDDSDFVGSIDQAGEEAKYYLKKVHAWAVELSEQGLAILSSYVGHDSTNLRIKIPNTDNIPVTVRNHRLRPELRLRPRHFKNYAPKSSPRIEEVIGRPFRQSTTPIFLSSLEEGPWSVLLDALTDAYREASGLPPTTPPPGTGPDSPFPLA